MSEIMRCVLLMPPHLWNNDPLDASQRHAIYREAWAEIERLTAIVERLPTDAEGERVAPGDVMLCQIGQHLLRKAAIVRLTDCDEKGEPLAVSKFDLWHHSREAAESARTKP